MALRKTGRAAKPRGGMKLRVPRRARQEGAPGILPDYRVTCSGCFEEFSLKGKELEEDLTCPLCDHTCEPPGRAFLEQMTGYTRRESRNLLMAAVPLVAAVLVLMWWFSVLSSRSATPQVGLAQAIDKSATEIPVSTTRGFSESGSLVIGTSLDRGEAVEYDGKTETSFTGVSRGAEEAMPAADHSAGTQVFDAGHKGGTVMRSLVFTLLFLGLLGFGIYQSIAYEKSLWTAYF